MRKKVISVALALAILNSQLACTRYKQVSLSTNEFFDNKQLTGYFEKYSVYVHTETGSYKIERPLIGENCTVSGNPVALPVNEDIETIKKPSSRKEMRSHKYDLNIYTGKSINGFTASDSLLSYEKPFSLEMSDISHVDVLAIDAKRTSSDITKALVIIGGTVLILVLTIVAINASADGSEGSIQSNSNSGSGGSSGSSGS